MASRARDDRRRSGHGPGCQRPADTMVGTSSRFTPVNVCQQAFTPAYDIQDPALPPRSRAR